MEKEINDWRDDFKLSQEDEEFLEELLEKKKICNYCRKQVSVDIGQVEIYCPHCEMITQAINVS